MTSHITPDGHPPRMDQDRLEQMLNYATSFSQEPRNLTFWETFWEKTHQYRARFAVGTAALAVAASVILTIGLTPPPMRDTAHPTVAQSALQDDVADLMLYQLLEDLS